MDAPQNWALWKRYLVVGGIALVPWVIDGNHSPIHKVGHIFSPPAAVPQTVTITGDLNVKGFPSSLALTGQLQIQDVTTPPAPVKPPPDPVKPPPDPVKPPPDPVKPPPDPVKPPVKPPQKTKLTAVVVYDPAIDGQKGPAVLKSQTLLDALKMDGHQLISGSNHNSQFQTPAWEKILGGPGMRLPALVMFPMGSNKLRAAMPLPEDEPAILNAIWQEGGKSAGGEKRMAPKGIE